MEKDKAKKKRTLIQPTIFGVEKFPITQKRTKKIGRNQFKVVAEFVRKETGEEANKKGVFKAKCSFCGKDFLTTNALGSHLQFCKQALSAKSKIVEPIEDEKSCVMLYKSWTTRDEAKNSDEKDLRTIKASQKSNTQIHIPPKVDKRQSNRGASTRNRYSSRQKVEFVDSVNQYLNEFVGENGRTVANYFSEVKQCRPNEVQEQCNRFYKWRKEEVYGNCLREILQIKKNQTGSKKKSRSLSSPFQEIETELYAKILDFRKKARRISSNWIRIEGRKIFQAKQIDDPGKWGGKSFKASYGWMRRFMARKKMKHRKRKNGKEKTAEECVGDFEKFLEKLRFDFLAPRDDSPAEDFESIWGRFPPELRYNMDQVPLPFVNGQDSTFTAGDDEDVNIKCPKESLRKRQYTMHLIFNAGRGNDAFGICDLVCRGKGLRINQAEKSLWDPNINVFWQGKAWVDNKVMRELAHSFVTHKNAAHGDKWVILFCDNLRAPLDDEVREIFGTGKVFLCYFPPNMTNFIQPIDAGLGRSVRTRIGHYLDEWLMEATNMETWEAKMTAGERRILTTNFIAKAMKDIMDVSNDDMRVKCFERTGCLMTWLVSASHDAKIKPQGIKDGMIKVPTVRREEQLEENNDLPEGMEPEVAAIAEEQQIINEEEENGDVCFDGDEDDGSRIDDN
jgi:hypothetical protein